MMLRRVDAKADWYAETCKDSRHNLPNFVHLAPGVYEWTCPACGCSKVFTVGRNLLQEVVRAVGPRE